MVRAPNPSYNLTYLMRKKNKHNFFIISKINFKPLVTLVRTKIQVCSFDPRPQQQFFIPIIAKKINKAPSVRVIVIFSDPKLQWRDFYKGR